MTDRALVATSATVFTKADILDAFATFLRLRVAQVCPILKIG
jgi:hypothetical protein